MYYEVRKGKGGSQYYICRPGEERPIAWFSDKKKALRKAAEMEGIPLKEYMKLRK